MGYIYNDEDNTPMNEAMFDYLKELEKKNKDRGLSGHSVTQQDNDSTKDKK